MNTHWEKKHDSKARLFWSVARPSLYVFSSMIWLMAHSFAGEMVDPLQMYRKLAPVTLRNPDLSKLAPGDQKAIPMIRDAANSIDEIYRQQVWAGNVELLERLKADRSKLGLARLDAFRVHQGPWSEIDGGRPFVNDVPAERPLGAGLYPESLSREQLQAKIDSLDKNSQAKAKSAFTVLRLDGEKLSSIPYSEAFRGPLQKSANLLKGAAAIADTFSLKKFLDLRAQALLSNDYAESENAWTANESPLEVTFGPYETYLDRIFNSKAAFEAIVGVRDFQETERLEKISKRRQEIENHLPIEASLRDPNVGPSNEIRIVNQLFSAGDANHGVRLAAYNLGKIVLLKNVQEAKFYAVLKPLGYKMLSRGGARTLNFETFFLSLMAHELAHSLGPLKMSKPRDRLRENYSMIEEAKADVTGIFLLQYLLSTGKVLGLTSNRKAGERSIYASYVMSCLRLSRAGEGNEHALAARFQLDTLFEKKAVQELSDGRWSIDFSKIPGVIELVVRDLMTLLARGDFAASEGIALRAKKPREEIARAIERSRDVPVDIRWIR